MTSLARHDDARERAIDRACELTSIGAGHAAGALATLLARPFEMSTPRPSLLEESGGEAPFAARPTGEAREWTGVLFEVAGGLGGTLALLLPPATRDALLAALLGEDAGAAAQAESALREVGNILASHALSVMGTVLGTPVLPSTPQLAAERGARELARLVAARSAGRAPLRIEVELYDRARALPMLVVYVPDAIA